MSIASEITRIKNAKESIATSIANKGVTVPEDTKIDGYSALVDQISGGGEVIPDGYADVSSVTATAEDVLSGEKFVAKDGTVVTGSMPIHSYVTKLLDTKTKDYIIPKGYHDGYGLVAVDTEEKTVKPPTSETAPVIIEPTSGKVLAKVTVEPLPKELKDVSKTNATPDTVLQGYSYVTLEGVVMGKMPNNGDVSGIIDGVNNISVTIPAGYTTGGTVTYTGDSGIGDAPFIGAVYPWITLEDIDITNNQFKDGVGLEDIRTVVLPNVENIATGGFMNAAKIEVLDIGANVVTINGFALNGCAKLTKLIFRGLFLNKLILNSTPINLGTGGFIYVPDEYLEQYKSDTNWTSFVNQIKPISEL